MLTKYGCHTLKNVWQKVNVVWPESGIKKSKLQNVDFGDFYMYTTLAWVVCSTCMYYKLCMYYIMNHVVMLINYVLCDNGGGSREKFEKNVWKYNSAKRCFLSFFFFFGHEYHTSLHPWYPQCKKKIKRKGKVRGAT